jgi:hypothetical protein
MVSVKEMVPVKAMESVNVIKDMTVKNVMLVDWASMNHLKMRQLYYAQNVMLLVNHPAKVLVQETV